MGVMGGDRGVDSDDSLEAEPRRLVGENKLCILGVLGENMLALRPVGATALGDLGDIKLAIRPRRGVGVPRIVSEPPRGDFGDWLALLLVVTRSLSRFANLTASLQH